jgi:hypothetical protein
MARATYKTPGTQSVSREPLGNERPSLYRVKDVSPVARAPENSTRVGPFACVLALSFGSRTENDNAESARPKMFFCNVIMTWNNRQTDTRTYCRTPRALVQGG